MTTSTEFHLIGLMSGTSGDGLDIAYCKFKYTQGWSFDIPHADTVQFPKKLEKKLKKSHKLSGEKLSLLDVDFGKWMGEQVRDFCEKHGLNPQAVASHGHTVFHQPSKGLSLQIGNGWALHVASGLPVINDFRMLDVQLGGQGAPLVPIGDRLLFSEYDYCIYLGGIANFSMEEDGKSLAFDMCPFNLLFNHYAQHCGKAYDKNGELARSGKIIPKMLTALNQLPFYAKTGAKSLGREDLEPYFAILDKGKHSPENILRTLLIHYVHQIKSVLKLKAGEKPKILITGGGAYNKFFMEVLEEALADEFIIAAAGETLISFKEALIFAFLGALKLKGENNTLASVTGASRDSCGGQAFGI